MKKPDDKKGGDVHSLHEKINSLGGSGRQQDVTPIGDEAVSVPVDEPAYIDAGADLDASAVATGVDLDYGELDDATEEPTKKGAFSPAQRIVVIVAGIAIFGVVIFKTIAGYSTKGVSPTVPELSESAVPSELPSLAAPVVEAPTPAAEPDSGTAAADAIGKPLTDPVAPAPVAGATPEVPPAPQADSAGTDALRAPTTVPAGMSPVPVEPPSMAMPAPATNPFVGPAPEVAPVAISPPGQSAPAAVTDDKTKARLASLEKEMSAAKAKLREHERMISAQSAAGVFPADGRPNVRVKWIASAAKNCGECKAKALLVVSNGSTAFVADGDTLNGYSVSIDGDRLVLSNNKGTYSYYSEPQAL